MSARTRGQPRDRSRVVCQRCHARKVKCDLASHIEHGRRCTNCEKRLEVCHRREQGKSNAQQRPRRPPPALRYPMVTPQQPSPELSPICSTRSTPRTGSVSSDGIGYVGELSVMSNQRVQATELSTGSVLRLHERRILEATQAEHLSPQPMVDALIETYFKHLYHRIPVVNHNDISPSCHSKLLQQSLCFAGSVLRHPKITQRTTGIQGEEFYANAKILFYTNHEEDSMTVLKSLCLLTLWTVTPPAVITHDCGWTWLGLAIRQALQMGLHKESTVSERSDPGNARRVAWFLYAQDKLHAACFGRPQMIRDDDFDVGQPTVTDFEISERNRAPLFIMYTELASILGRICRLRNTDLPASTHDILAISTRLREWALRIPTKLQIIGDGGNLVYQREVYEVLIWYFTCLITFCHVYKVAFRHSMASTMSLLASSCAIRLYQEMDYRDDINYLPVIYNWSMMVVSLPQLSDTSCGQHTSISGVRGCDHTSSSTPELDAIMDIISNRTVKFPGAQAIVSKLSSLREQAQCGVTNATDRLSLATHIESPLVLHQMSDFFPFPEALSSKLELVSTFETEEHLEGQAIFPDWSFEDLMSMDNMDAFL